MNRTLKKASSGFKQSKNPTQGLKCKIIMTRSYQVNSRHLQLQILLISFLSSVLADSNNSSSMVESSTQPLSTATTQITGKMWTMFEKCFPFKVISCVIYNAKISINYCGSTLFRLTKPTSKHFDLIVEVKRAKAVEITMTLGLEKRICIHKLFDFTIQFMWFIEHLKHMLINITRFIIDRWRNLKSILKLFNIFGLKQIASQWFIKCIENNCLAKLSENFLFKVSIFSMTPAELLIFSECRFKSCLIIMGIILNL